MRGLVVRVVVREEARSPEIVGSESGVEGGVISLLRLCGVGLEGEGGLVDAGVRVVDAILATICLSAREDCGCLRQEMIELCNWCGAQAAKEVHAERSIYTVTQN